MATRKIFGAPVPLEGRIPDFFSICLSFLELHARETVGIFRVSGAKDKIEQIRDQFEKGERLDFNPTDDIFNVAGAFRLWLKSMPDPLIPFELYNKVIDFGKTLDTSKKQLSALRKLMSSLPSCRLAMLVRLCRLLRLIAVNSDINKMPADNLAIVLTPNLLRSEHPTVSVDTLTENTIATKLISILIQQYDITLDGLQVEPAPPSAAEKPVTKAPSITISTDPNSTGSASDVPSISPRESAGLAEEVHESKKRRPSINRSRPPPQFDNALAWLVDASKTDGLQGLANPEKAAKQAEAERKKKEEEEKEVRRLAEEEFNKRQQEREAQAKKEEEKARKKKEKIREKAERIVAGVESDD